MTGSLLRDLDLDKRQILDLLTLAGRLKRDRRNGDEIPRLLGRSIVLVFEKNSTRTRCSFEVAVHDQGGRVTYLGPEGSHLGREESAADTARVLGRLYDGIAFRGYAQDTVEQFADHAGVPVWNALTDAWHPTQSLADILTMTEHHGAVVEDIAFCFTGDGRGNLLPYRVTDEVLDAADRSGVRFMHCLPAIHNRSTAIGARLYERFGLDGAEVTEEVFESKRSIVFDQAENRMHTIKALLVRALAG